MRRFLVGTRGRGNFPVSAETVRHAVARVVARLKLTEEETASVVNWFVSPQDGPGCAPAGGTDETVEYIPCHVEGAK
ncbi:MAG: hypothetical protein J6V72_10070 [Kiritimatiellae bacterium]|nr:hypothetical protein [Kiritimatiellia bacterium]